MTATRALDAALALALALGLAACGTATWSDALRASADGPPVARAELAFVAGHDAAGALAAAERILEATDPRAPEAGRALMLALEASRATGELERPLTWLAEVLAATDDPRLAARLAGEHDRYASRLDGGSILAGREALTAVLARPGAAWEPARAEAFRQLAALDGLVGKRAGATVEAPAGPVARVTDWRLSAPWGRTPELDLDRPLGPEARPLADRETTGASWDRLPVTTTTGRFSDGELTFFDLAGGGIGFAEARVDAPFAGQRTVVRMETNRRARLYVDGREVLARTLPDAPWLAAAVVAIPAGGARLTVKLASPDGTGFVAVTLSALGDGEWPGPEPISVAVGDSERAVLALADLDARLSRPGLDLGGARARLASLERRLGESPTLDLLAARLARIDPRTPAPIQRKEARARLERVRTAWPKNPVALRALARLEKDEEQPDRAQALLGELGADARTLLERLDIQRARGWEADALETVAALRAKAGLATSSPRVLQEIIDAERAFGRMQAARADAERLHDAFPAAGLSRLAELEVDAGLRAEAAAHFREAFALEPERHALLRSAIAALRAEGSPASLDAARADLDAFLAARPDDAWAWAEKGRLALQRGQRDEAVASLEQALAWHPDFAPVEALLAELGGRPQAFDEVEDGRALLAAYRADPTTADWTAFPIVSVLERNLVDVRADGSTLELQHKVRVVQSKAGADALGDFAPPDGARLLVARTLKADGRVLYPERTEGKSDLSFPDLQVGDAVETALVVRSRVTRDEGGYLTGVSFAGWSAPTWRQDARFHLASGLELVATRFGGAPEAVVATLPDGSRTWAWSGARLPAIPREPLAIGARSFFPFADLRVVESARGAAPEAAWAAIATSFASRLARVLVPGPRTRALAKDLGSVEAAFTWVKTDMEDAEQQNLVETPVESAIALQKGHRAIALLALARAQGRSAELWLCAPERDGRPEDRAAPTPNANRFFYPVVVAEVGGRAVYLDPSRPWMPWDAVPAELRGARCLVPERAARLHADVTAEDVAALWSEVPAADPREPEPFELEVDVEVAASGDAKATLRGLARGVPAVVLRQLWQSVDDARRRALWEQWAGSLALGAKVVSYEVTDAEDTERPMRWTLALEVPGWARPDGGGLVVGKPLATLTANDFANVAGLSTMASLAARKTPLRVAAHAERVTLRVQLPAGFVAADLPPELDLAFGPQRVAQHVTQDGATVVVTRRVRFVPGRVDPADYAAFRTFIDQAERGLGAPLRARPGP